MRLAAWLADASGAQLVAAFVSESDHPFARNDREFQRLLRDHMTGLRAGARQACGALADRGDLDVVATPGVTSAIGLHDLARDWGSDLLVVGSTHRGPVGRVFPGSTAERLLVDAPCPIAIAPQGFAKRPLSSIGRIGVGTDGTRSGGAALAVAEELARGLAAELEVFSPAGPAQARRLFEREAERFDLLVLGAARHGPLEHAAPLSPIRSLMNGASFPVVVVPHDFALR